MKLEFGLTLLVLRGQTPVQLSLSGTYDSQSFLLNFDLDQRVRKCLEQF